MSVRYKFKNDLEFNAVPCDGFHISVLDLKRTIIRAKRLGRITDFDLQITNQQTGEVYSTEDDLIPKNSTLIIVRVPLSAGQKKIWEAEKLPSGNGSSVSSSSDKNFTASSSTDGASEEDKISSMMSTSAEMYDRKNWVVYRGKAAFPGKPPPLTYRCNRCHQTGHWVQDCALIKAGMGGQELKKTTGIPRSFLKPANIDTPGAKIDPQGMYMVNELETQAYRDKKVDKPVWDNDSNVTSATVNLEIPSDLKCPVCHDLLKDAIMLPTCACATCDECARNSLIESENNACPVCNEPDNCPDDLIPCRKLRDKVNKFKNTSGYASSKSSLPQSPKNATPTLPDIVLPNQFDLIRDGGVPKVVSPALNALKQTEDSPNILNTRSDSYNNSPYGNVSEDAATPLTSEPPIPGVVDNDEEVDVFKSKVPARSPSTPKGPPSPRPKSPVASSVYTNGLPIPVSLPDTSLPPPGFMGTLPTYLPPPLSRYPPHNPAFRGGHHHMPLPGRFHHRDPPPLPTANYIEDPLETFNRIMAQKDQKKKYRSRSRSPHYRHSPHRRTSPRYPPPRGPRTPPLSPRVSSTPPPGDSPPPSDSRGGRRSPSITSPRRYSRSRSRSRVRSPDYPRRYYEEDRYSRRPYANEHHRYNRDSHYAPYREDYHRSSRSSRPPAPSRVKPRGRPRTHYERRSPPPPPHRDRESSLEQQRSRRDQRSFSNERTPSLSPEPVNSGSRFSYNNASSSYPPAPHHHHPDNYREEYRSDDNPDEEESPLNERNASRHHRDEESSRNSDYHRSDEFAEAPADFFQEDQEGEEEPPIIPKKKKEKKKKRKKEEAAESIHETEDQNKKKKKKAKKVKTKKPDEEERLKRKSKDDPDEDAFVPEGESIRSSVLQEEGPVERRIHPEEEGPSATSSTTTGFNKLVEQPRQAEEQLIELVPELSKWEREDLVADSSTSPAKEERDYAPDTMESSRDEDSADLREVLKGKKEGPEEDEDKNRKGDSDPEEEINEDEEESRKKKKKKKKQKEMAKKIEKKLRKEMKKKLKEKLKKKKALRESSGSPLPSPSPPKEILSSGGSRRSRDVKSERCDGGLKITIDRHESPPPPVIATSRSPSMERKRRRTRRRSTSEEEEFNRNKASLMKLSGTDFRGESKSNSSNSIQPSRKLSIKDRLGPIKRSRSRSPTESRRSNRDVPRKREESSTKEPRRRYDEGSRDKSAGDSRSNQIHSVPPSDSRRKSESSRRSRERMDVSGDKKRRRGTPSPSKDTSKRRGKEGWPSSGDYPSKRDKKKESSRKDESSDRSRKGRSKGSSSKIKSRYDSVEAQRNSRGYNSDSN